MRSTIAVMTAVMLFAACRTLQPAPDSGPWTRFFDETTDRYGYRDVDGTIRIPPVFIMAGAHEFHTITAVVEQTGEQRFTGYYLLKTGEIVGNGCLYLWDNAPDCECEGKIRFRDAATGKVGFFDDRGQVAIPAEYSDAQPFRNNLAMVLQGAERVCLDGSPWSADHRDCEHWQWRGGRMFLIDEQNKVVIDDFPYTTSIDWFSRCISTNKDQDPLRDAFKATDGRYWSFVNVEKEFRYWVESEFLPLTTPEALGRCVFDEITCWVMNAGEWRQERKNRFLKKNGRRILHVIERIRNGTIAYEIQKVRGLNPYIFQGSRYAAYFDVCRNPLDWKYPVFDLVVSCRDQNDGGSRAHQDVFEFLRTVDGDYRLVSVSMHPLP